MDKSIRPCRVCGERKPENGVGDRPVRCRDCSNEYRRTKRAAVAEPGACAYCAAPFARYGTAKVCSDECRRQWARLRRGVEPLVARDCSECGTEFKPARMNSLTCSTLCSGRARTKRREANPEYVAYRKAYGKRYAEENRDAVLSRGRAWRLANGERHRELSREWSRRNRYRVSWRQRNPEKHAAKQRVRTERLRRLTPESIPHAKVIAKMAYWGNACWICGVPWEAVDHVKPISKDGLNVVANMRPICTVCNSRKRNKWFGVAGLHLLST